MPERPRRALPRAGPPSGRDHGNLDGTILGSTPPEIGNVPAPLPTASRTSDFWGRDITVLDADGKPDTLEVFACVAAAVKVDATLPTATDPTRTITRYGALGRGRSFSQMGEIVLQADAAWEGNILASPAAVHVAGEVLLYYSRRPGGIGLARSGDSHTFVEDPRPRPRAGRRRLGARAAVPRKPEPGGGENATTLLHARSTGWRSRPGVTSIPREAHPKAPTGGDLGSVAPRLRAGALAPGRPRGEAWSLRRATSPGTRYVRGVAPSRCWRTCQRGFRPGGGSGVYYGALDSHGNGTVGAAPPAEACRNGRAPVTVGEPGVRHEQAAEPAGAVRGALRRLHVPLRDGGVEHDRHQPGHRGGGGPGHGGAACPCADVTPRLSG